MYANQKELIMEFSEGRATFGAAGRLIVYGDTLYSQSEKEEGLQMVAIRVGQNFFLMQQIKDVCPDNRSYIKSVFKELSDGTEIGFDYDLGTHCIFFVKRDLDQYSPQAQENPSYHVRLEEDSLDFVQDQLEHAAYNTSLMRVDQERMKSWLQQFKAWRKKYDWRSRIRCTMCTGHS